MAVEKVFQKFGDSKVIGLKLFNLVGSSVGFLSMGVTIACFKVACFKVVF